MSRKAMIFGFVVLSLLLLACACNMGDYFSNIVNRIREEVAGPTGLDETVSLPEAEDTPEVVQEDSPEPVEETVEAEEPLIEISWLVAETPLGLWAVDDQGDDFHSIFSGQFISESSAAPNGGFVAYIQSETEYGEGVLQLGVIDLQSGNSTVQMLTNEQTVHYQNEDMNVGDNTREANMAMMFDNLIWSPNGRYLAFVGAQQDQFAGLYAYDTESGLTNRLVGVESHVFNPSWSPDSQFILAPSAYTFGTGAGFAMDAMWIARPDGTEMRSFYDASSVIDEEVWGWMDEQTVLLSSVDIMAGYKNLRLMNINSGAIQEINGNSDYFYDADISPAAGTVMFSFPFDDMLDWVEGETITERGLYLYRSDTAALEKITDTVDYGSWVVWNEQIQCYHAYLSLPVGGASGYMETYSPYGRIDGSCPMLPMGVTQAPTFSSSGAYYVWKTESWENPESNALWVGNMATEEAVIVVSGPVSFSTWHPGEDVLFFAQDNLIYKASAPDFVPELVADAGATVNDLYWALP